MAILELWAVDVARPRVTERSGLCKGAVIHVWPDDNVDGWTDLEAYVAEYGNRILVRCPGLPFERAKRGWKERWVRPPIPGENEYDLDFPMDDVDRVIELGRKRWQFNVDPDNDPIPEHPGRAEKRRIMAGEHIITAYENGPRAVQLNPWFHDRCKTRVDTLVDVDDYDVHPNQAKSPRARAMIELNARKAVRGG